MIDSAHFETDHDYGFGDCKPCQHAADSSADFGVFYRRHREVRGGCDMTYGDVCAAFNFGRLLGIQECQP